MQNIIDQLFSSKKNIYLLIAFSILVRLLMFISDGHNSDFDFFEYWADRIVNQGFTNIYSLPVNRFECDYPPLYLYVLGLLGHLYHFFNLELHSYGFDIILKIFNLACEGFFIYFFYKQTKNRTFLLFLLLNPATIVNAYAWGQIDILYTILLFCSFYFLFNRNLFQSAIFLALSLSLKTQTLLFLPLFGIFFLRVEESFYKKVMSFLLFLFIFILPAIPFILYAQDPLAPLKVHISAAGRYNFIAVNAFNIWWGLYGEYALKLKSLFPPNDTLVFGLFSRKILAYACFSLVYLYILYVGFFKSKSTPQKVSLIALLSFSYFMFLPEMHERYLFPYFIFAAWLCAFYTAEIYYFITLSFIHIFNLLWAWGEQKFFDQYWFFQAGRIAGIISFIIWCFYLMSNLKRFRTEQEV